MRWTGVVIALVCGVYGLLVAVSLLGVPLGPLSSLPGTRQDVSRSAHGHTQQVGPSTAPVGTPVTQIGAGPKTMRLGDGKASAASSARSASAQASPTPRPSSAFAVRRSTSGKGHSSSGQSTGSAGPTTPPGSSPGNSGSTGGSLGSSSSSGAVTPRANGRSGALPSAAAIAQAFSVTRSPGVTSSGNANPASLLHPTPSPRR